MQEIERKFLLSRLPESVSSAGNPEERYFLYIDDESEIRIQRKGNDRFTLQNKASTGALHDIKQTISITAQQFEGLKAFGNTGVERVNYTLPNIPGATIKVYSGRFRGLIRAEVEFDTEAQAQSFQVPDWFGAEITDTPLGRDRLLVQLDESSFKDLLAGYEAHE
jgi:adenylate cyclase